MSLWLPTEIEMNHYSVRSRQEAWHAFGLLDPFSTGLRSLWRGDPGQ